MHFLFLQTINAQHELPFVIQNMGHKVSYLPNHCFDPNDLRGGDFIKPVEEFLDSDPSVDIVITYQFHPMISDLCEDDVWSEKRINSECLYDIFLGWIINHDWSNRFINYR